MIALFLAGLSSANVYPFTVTAALETAPDRADLAIARLILTGGSAVLLAPLALGFLADQIGIDRTFGIAVLFSLAALLLVLGIRARSSW